jgi:acyl-CoA-binding protein
MSELFETAIVEKRNVLNAIRSNSMTLQELRFFSIYLSKINPWDKSTRVVRFPLDDFRRIMGLGAGENITHFRYTIRHILQQVVEVPNEKGNGYTAFQLFKKAKIEKDENGKWYVEFDAHDDALPLMFDFKNRYFKYELWNALRLKSPNQVRMYEILKQYEGLGKRELTIKELRELLGIGKKEYDRWDNFKRKVLDSCQQALKETTDICYTYERGKTGAGGKWLTIVFYIKRNENHVDPLSLDEFITQQPEPEPLIINTTGENVGIVGQTSFFDDDSTPNQSENYEDEDEKWVRIYGSERKAELAAACKYEFNKEQISVIFGLMRDLPIPPDRLTNDLHYGRVFWLTDLYNKFLVAAHQAEIYGKPIQNRYRYFCRMIENYDEYEGN